MLESMQDHRRKMSKMGMLGAILGLGLAAPLDPPPVSAFMSAGRSIPKAERERRKNLKKIADKSRRRNRR